MAAAAPIGMCVITYTCLCCSAVRTPFLCVLRPYMSEPPVVMPGVHGGLFRISESNIGNINSC